MKQFRFPWFSRRSTAARGQSRRAAPRVRLALESLEDRCVPAVTFTKFDIPTAESFTNSVVVGPDNHIWFTEQSANKIGRMNGAGVITEFTIPTSGPVIPGFNPTGSSRPITIQPGPDGNLWFTELLGNKIARITTEGVITEFLLPTPNSQPGGLVAGPDGNLWMSLNFTNRIARFNPFTQEYADFPIPTSVPPTSDNPTGSSAPRFMRAGPDGNVWFSELLGNKIARITPEGVITEFQVPTTIQPWTDARPFGIPPVPTGNPIGSAMPRGLVVGQDGNFWFSEFAGNKIGRITLDGVITEFDVPSADSIPFGITVAPDGNIWFGENNQGKIGVISHSGEILSERGIPITVAGNPNIGPFDLQPGPHARLMFPEAVGNRIDLIQGIVDGNGTFIQAMYQLALGRFGTPSEVATWDQVVRSAGDDPVADTIERSAEARKRLAVSWYGIYLNRLAGAGEESWAVDRLLQGATEEEVLGDLFATSEFGDRANALVGSSDDRRNFVEALYRLLLKRQPAEDEVTGWLNALPFAGRRGLAMAFLSSAEYRGRQVRAHYAGLLERTFPPSQAEVDSWVFGRQDLTSIRVAFESSSEFFQKGFGVDPLVDFDPPLTTGAVTEFSMGFSGRPGGVSFTPDGQFIFFTEQFDTKVGLFNAATGAVLEFPVQLGTLPHSRIALPDGAIWFTGLGDRIGRFDLTTHEITYFTTGISAGAIPHDMAFPGDGFLYFTELGCGCLGRMDFETKEIEEFLIGEGTEPHAMAVDTDGTILVTLEGDARVARFHPDTQTFTHEFSLSPGSRPHDIIFGIDGNLYMTEFTGNRMAKFEVTTRQVTEFPSNLPEGYDSSYLHLVNGADGNIYFTQPVADLMGRLDPRTGIITHIRTGILPISRPLVLTPGPDGNIWFSEPFRGRLARLDVSKVDEFQDPERSFVATIYRDLLRRVPSEGELDNFTNQLKAGTSRMEVVRAVQTTDEYFIGQIQGTYLQLLGHPADQTAINHFLPILRGGGGLGQLLFGILSSDEYFQNRGGGTIDGFLAALYADGIRRPIDGAGHQFFSQMLAFGAPRSSAVAGVLFSPEAAASLVTSLYRRYLIIRDATPAEVASGVDHLLQQMPGDLIDAAIIASEEYRQLRTVGPTPLLGIPLPL